MTDGKKQFDVEAAMRNLAETDRLIDSALTEEVRQAVARLAARSDGRELYAAGQTLLEPEDFDLLVTADALETLAVKVRAVVRVKEASLYEKVLDVYAATV